MPDTFHPLGSGAYVPVLLPFRSGLYYAIPPTNNLGTSATLGNGTARAVPFYVPNAVTLTRIGSEVTTVGEAGSKLRLGIYADDGTGFPGALVIDAGQVAGDSATVQELTISQALTAGLYWAVGAVQAAATLQPTIRVVGAVTTLGAGTGSTVILTAGQGLMGYLQTGVTGAFGSPWTGTASSGSTPRIFVKVA